jgi:small subunit ribosomal protein S6
MDARDYELMYIVRPTVSDEQLPGVTQRVDAMVSGLGGEVTQNQPWGKRRLAYPIEKHEDGYYVVSKIRLDTNKTRDLEEQLRIYDDVIRHILVTAIATPMVAPPPAQVPAPSATSGSSPSANSGSEARPETDETTETTEE